MEKVNVYDLDGKKKNLVDIPQLFHFKPRKDLVQIASEIASSKNKQVQGRNKRAGLRNTAEGWGTGHGMARTPRIQGSGFPTARNAGRVPYAKGGRRAHPVKTEKVIEKKINKKVNKLSIISAISASGDLEWVKNRGHKIDKVPEIPLVIDDKVQTVKKTKFMYSILTELGLEDDLIRVKKGKKTRAGKGKRRGRKYKGKKSILIVIKDDFGIIKAAKNIPGIDVVKFENLSIENLAPGGLPGRLTLWVQSAFNELEKYEAII
ncbi:MAG: 50S ribosomal protein L4 [Candidatus Hermodarchaeota archaeon]